MMCMVWTTAIISWHLAGTRLQRASQSLSGRSALLSAPSPVCLPRLSWPLPRQMLHRRLRSLPQVSDPIWSEVMMQPMTASEGGGGGGGGGMHDGFVSLNVALLCLCAPTTENVLLLHLALVVIHGWLLCYKLNLCFWELQATIAWVSLPLSSCLSSAGCCSTLEALP